MTAPRLIKFDDVEAIKARLEQSAGTKMRPTQIDAVAAALAEQSISVEGALMKTRSALAASFDHDAAPDDTGLEILATSVAAGPSHKEAIKEAALPDTSQSSKPATDEGIQL